jgi:transcriptional regulator with XRE-family HTH domain
MLCRRQGDQGVCFCNLYPNISKNQTIQKYPNKLKLLDNLASIAYTLTMTTDTLAEVPTPGSHKGNGGGHIPDTENNVGNIVEEIRKGASITQKRLASMAGLSTLYIIRAEQGMSLTLPNGLLLALSGVDPYHRDPHKIQSLYMKQREDMINYFLDRVHNKGITNDTTYPSNNDILQQALDYALDNYTPAVGSREGPKASHPLYLFRTKFCELHGLPASAIKFCQMFGIHPATISEIERRENTIEKNSVIFLHLKRLGLSAEQLEQLCRACNTCL